MRLLRSLAMLLPLVWILCLQELKAQSPGATRSSSRSLDALLQDYAYRAFVRPKTGLIYDGEVPSNLTGIEIAAMRLRSGSLRTKGVKSYREFEIPQGVVVQPYAERLVLVYQNLGNWSLLYYPLPGYTYLAPVLGLLAYDAFDLSATSLQELDLKASNKPMLINFSDVKSVPEGSTAKCVTFDLQGSMQLNNVVSGNVCSTFQQGHFSIVIESTASFPAPVPLTGGTESGRGGGGNAAKVWKIVGIVIGGFVALVLLGFMLMWMHRYKQRKKLEEMEKEAEVGEALQMTSIGNTRAPVAMGTRTQPVLEKEYVP